MTTLCYGFCLGFPSRLLTCQLKLNKREFQSVLKLVMYRFQGGAGGKGVWGKLGDELNVQGVADEKDPNYDSDSTVNKQQTKLTVDPLFDNSGLGSEFDSDHPSSLSLAGFKRCSLIVCGVSRPVAGFVFVLFLSFRRML